MKIRFNSRRTATALLATAAAACALPASAQSSPVGRPYVGAGIGVIDWRADTLNGVPADTSGTGLKVYGGYTFHPNFALELGYAHLGKLRGAGGEVKADAGFLDAVGLLPLTPAWSLLGRVGVVDAKVRNGFGSDWGTNLKFGGGVQYQLNQNVSLRGEWERYRLDTFGSKTNTDLYTVGINYAF
jgi:OOP family OmpA-OmpF porin